MPSGGHFTPRGQTPGTPAGQPHYTQFEYIQQAAVRWGVPAWILYGVWGIETDFGRNVATSSAGAVGDFQFIPTTAAAYKYPLTNHPDPTQFGQQADAAAHYLHDLFKSTGSWDAALQGYSGGGYGLADVKVKAQKGGGTLSPTFGNDVVSNTVGGVINAIGSGLSGLAGIASAIGTIVGDLTDPHFWLRLVMGAGAILLLMFGLVELSGHRDDATSAAAATVMA